LLLFFNFLYSKNILEYEVVFFSVLLLFSSLKKPFVPKPFSNDLKNISLKVIVLLKLVVVNKPVCCSFLFSFIYKILDKKNKNNIYNIFKY